MKPLKENIQKAVAIAAKSEAGFRPEIYSVIENLITSTITPEDIDAINKTIVTQKRRKLEIADIIKVAYIHCRSIFENGGYSPYQRITNYEGVTVDNCQVKIITEALLLIEFFKIIKEEDRKAHKCRQYLLAPDVLEAIKNKS